MKFDILVILDGVDRSKSRTNECILAKKAKVGQNDLAFVLPSISSSEDHEMIESIDDTLCLPRIRS